MPETTDFVNIKVAIYKIARNFDDLANYLLHEKSYSEQRLKDNLNNDFNLKLFYRKKPIRDNYKTFFGEIVNNEEAIIKDETGISKSFVMILQKNSSSNIYAIAGGLGYHAIQDCVVDNFGIEILSRLISKNDKVIKSAKERSVVGGILGANKFFRSSYNLYENDNFGKIYQELKTGITKDILKNKFGFSDDGLKRDSSCIAKSSFQISKSISFNQIFKIIDGCESIYNDSDLEPIEINSVKKLKKKKSEDLINSLEEQLFEQLWQRYNGEGNSYDFDLCYKDFEKYLIASKFIVRKINSNKDLFVFSDDTLNNIDQLFVELRRSEENFQEKDDFSKFLKMLLIVSYDQDENHYLTKGLLFNHLFGDVTFNNKKYFFLDGDWYQIDDKFIEELNDGCKNFIKSHKVKKELPHKWSAYHNEDTFNEKFVSQNLLEDKTLVLHKITPDNIEMCDILKWDDEYIYFYHVKKGFMLSNFNCSK